MIWEYSKPGRMTFFGWVKYILWMIVVDYSFQSQGSDGSSLTIDDVSPMSNGCSCPDREGKLYNFEPLGFKNETPSLKVDGATYEGYSYSYNPCHPFKLEPENGGCPLKAGVAICKWVPNLKESADNYIPIGHQEGASCDYDEKFKTPVVKYEILSPNQFGKSTVILKCAEENRDKAIFEILDEDDLIFQLTHFWEVCPSKSETENTIVAVSAAAVVAVTGLACLVRYFRKKRNENNDNGEREQLLRNGNVIHNPIEELNREIGSRPTPIGSSHTKADVNVIRSAFNWF